jgi:hypothetical protein
VRGEEIDANQRRVAQQSSICIDPALSMADKKTPQPNDGKGIRPDSSPPRDANIVARHLDPAALRGAGPAMHGAAYFRRAAIV